MADLIVTNGYVVTLDPDRRVIPSGAVAIEGDRIVGVGAADEIAAAHPAAETIDAAGAAVIPGLIDVHAHAGHGLVKTLGAGDNEAWYRACRLAYTVGSTPEFWRAEAQLAALERLRFGVTTGVSLLGGGDSIMRTDDPVYGDAHMDGVLEVGTRSVVAVGSTRPPHPLTYARWEDGARTDYPVDYARQRDTCVELADRWHGRNGMRTNVAMLTPTLRAEHVESIGREALEQARAQAREMSAIARERGLVFTQDGHQKGSVAYAYELGILGPEALLSHSTGLTDEEIRICADTGTKIAHNPSAVASILARCPATELLEAGVTVGLGSDATAPDRNADMFRHMQQCMHYHRTFHRDPSWLPPGKVLEMCTIDAAKALGMEASIGSIEVGKKADLALIDLRRPHMAPANMPLQRIVCFANGNDVLTVIVDGVVRLRDRRATSINEDRVIDAAEREAALMIERLGLEPLLETPADFWRAVKA